MRWLLLPLLLGCASAEFEEACEKACDRPFALEAQTARQLKPVWSRFPDGPAREQALAAFGAWQERFAKTRAAWSADCVQECVAARDERAVDCRRRAQSLTAWKDCP